MLFDFFFNIYLKYKIYHLSAYAMQMKVMIICILIKQIRLLILWYSDEKLHRFSLMQVLFTSFIISEQRAIISVFTQQEKWVCFNSAREGFNFIICATLSFCPDTSLFLFTLTLPHSWHLSSSSAFILLLILMLFWGVWGLCTCLETSESLHTKESTIKYCKKKKS